MGVLGPTWVASGGASGGLCGDLGGPWGDMGGLWGDLGGFQECVWGAWVSLSETLGGFLGLSLGILGLHVGAPNRGKGDFTKS